MTVEPRRRESQPCDPPRVQATLESLRAEMLALEDRASAVLEQVPPPRRRSAQNLAHYVALRRHDLRDLQEALSGLGLSSLGRAEPCALAAVEAVLGHLARLTGRAAPTPPRAPVTLAEGRVLLEERTAALLGPRPANRRVRVLATLPGEAADDPALLRALLRAGTDLVRVNTGHDDPDTWVRLCEQVRAQARDLNHPCRILIDLAGPKLRTGPLLPGPQVVTWRPQRDRVGRVTAPARVWLAPEGVPPPDGGADAVLPVSSGWLAQLVPGDEVELTDHRGSRRVLSVAEACGEGRWLLGDRRAFVVPGTRLVHRPAGGGTGAGAHPLGALPAREEPLRLIPGELLLLTRDATPGHPPGPGHSARIGCTLPLLLGEVRAGERVLFDDGRIEGRAERVDEAGVWVRIQRAPRAGGERLRADQGIHLPDLAARVAALTPRDREVLPTVARLADAVGLSFAHSPEDLDELWRELAAIGAPEKGIVLKVETRAAFEGLPALLLAALRHPNAGVMIARGDLAVECGFQRLAEAQEEILWMCEAAHLPVIWATQVLEQLTKSGQPSRAEITDAAMGERAECVMLNKGAHLLEAVQALDDVLRRMQDHQSKKRAMLRPLRLARGFLPG